MKLSSASNSQKKIKIENYEFFACDKYTPLSRKATSIDAPGGIAKFWSKQQRPELILIAAFIIEATPKKIVFHGMEVNNLSDTNIIAFGDYILELD